MNYIDSIFDGFNDGFDCNKALGLRSLRVKLLRKLFMLSAAVAGGLFVGFGVFSIIMPKQDLQKTLIVGDEVIIANPRFIGHSASGGKIMIVADNAKRAIDANNKVVKLENPHVTTESGADLTAKEGRWNQESQELELSENVKYKNRNGDNASANKAFWTPFNPLETDISDPKTISREQISNLQSILWMTGNVKFARDGGDDMSSEIAIWNDKTEVLQAQENVVLNSNGYQLKANDAKFDRGAGRAIANGNVVITNKDFKAESQHLDFDNNQKIATGSGGVAVHTPKAFANADNYVYYFDTKRAILKGKVRGVLN